MYHYSKIVQMLPESPDKYTLLECTTLLLISYPSSSSGMLDQEISRQELLPLIIPIYFYLTAESFPLQLKRQSHPSLMDCYEVIDLISFQLQPQSYPSNYSNPLYFSSNCSTTPCPFKKSVILKEPESPEMQRSSLNSLIFQIGQGTFVLELTSNVSLLNRVITPSSPAEMNSCEVSNKLVGRSSWSLTRCKIFKSLGSRNIMVPLASPTEIPLDVREKQWRQGEGKETSNINFNFKEPQLQTLMCPSRPRLTMSPDGRLSIPRISERP